MTKLIENNYLFIQRDTNNIDPGLIKAWDTKLKYDITTPSNVKQNYNSQ